MVWICGEVSGPVEAAIVVPDGEDVLWAGSRSFYLAAEDLVHQCDEVFCGVAVSTDYFFALIKREFFHHALDYIIGVIIEFLEVMTKISKDMRALEDSLEEAVLALEVTKVLLLCDT